MTLDSHITKKDMKISKTTTISETLRLLNLLEYTMMSLSVLLIFSSAILNMNHIEDGFLSKFYMTWINQLNTNSFESILLILLVLTTFQKFLNVPDSISLVFLGLTMSKIIGSMMSKYLLNV
jgi:hypothetical protein